MSQPSTQSPKLHWFLEFLLIITILLMPMQAGFNTKSVATKVAHALRLGQAPPTPGAPVDTPPPSDIQRIIELIPNANFTVADILIWLLFVLWFLKVLLNNEFRTVRPWPLCILALLGCVVASMVPAWKPSGITVNMNDAVKELIQFLEYFFAAYIVFMNAASYEATFRRMAIAFWISTTIVIIVAMLQYMNLPELESPLARFFEPTRDPMSVRALFDNRNVLGGFLAMLIPFMWGVVLCEKNWLIKIWLTLACIAGLVVTLSGGAMAAILLAVFAITSVRGQKVFVPLLIIAFLVAIYVWPQLPRQNSAELRDSILLYKPVPEGEGWPWQQRYVEWQPALAAISHSPFVGVGVGNYQRHINIFYGYINKPGGRNYMEPNAINGYAVLGVTAGVPALLALIWILLYFRRKTAMAYETFTDGLERGIALGLFGSLTGFIIVMFFTDIFVRGLGPVFVLLLAFSAFGGRFPAPPAKEEQPENKK